VSELSDYLKSLLDSSPKAIVGVLSSLLPSPPLSPVLSPTYSFQKDAVFQIPADLNFRLLVGVFEEIKYNKLVTARSLEDMLAVGRKQQSNGKSLSVTFLIFLFQGIFFLLGQKSSAAMTGSWHLKPRHQKAIWIKYQEVKLATKQQAESSLRAMQSGGSESHQEAFPISSPKGWLGTKSKQT
jgi:hypothetical protein